jgi:hypothetical protein
VVIAPPSETTAAPSDPASTGAEASTTVTDESCATTDASSPDATDTSGAVLPASSTGPASSRAPASSEATGRLATVESSATKPSLKCVTCPVATLPCVVVATVSKPVPPSVDHTMIG